MRKHDSYNHLIVCENCKWCNLENYFPYCTLHKEEKGLFQVCDKFERYEVNTEN